MKYTVLRLELLFWYLFWGPLNATTNIAIHLIYYHVANVILSTTAIHTWNYKKFKNSTWLFLKLPMKKNSIKLTVIAKRYGKKFSEFNILSK